MIDFKNGSLIKLTKTGPEGAQDVLPLLIPGEEIIGVYKTVRDHVVFTTKRAICVNIQGLTGRKKDYTSLPYSKIQTFSIETAGLLDLDCELEMWFSGLGLVKLEFRGDNDIIKIGQFIGSAIL